MHRRSLTSRTADMSQPTSDLGYDLSRLETMSAPDSPSLSEPTTAEMLALIEMLDAWVEVFDDAPRNHAVLRSIRQRLEAGEAAPVLALSARIQELEASRGEWIAKWQEQRNALRVAREAAEVQLRCWQERAGASETRVRELTFERDAAEGALYTERNAAASGERQRDSERLDCDSCDGCHCPRAARGDSQ